MSRSVFAAIVSFLIFTSAAFALTQPDAEPKSDLFSLGQQNMPELQWVMAREVQPFPVYGIYTWFGEYMQLRKQIKQVGWKTLRIGGPSTDENMAVLFDDGLNFSIMVPGPKKGKRDAFDSDQAYIDASVAAVSEFMNRFGEGGSFYKKYPRHKDKFLPFVQLRNEPNFHYMYKAGTEADRQQLYAKLAPQLIELIHRRSPRTKVISFSSGGAGAGDMRFVERVLKIDPASITKADAFSTHPYVHPAPPEVFKVESWGKYSMANSLNTLRKTFDKYNRRDIPVWYTEGGWTISKADGGAYDASKETVDPMFQAAYNCRYYAWALRLGVDCVTTMFITDTDGCAAGFFDRLRGMAWRPNAHALQNMINIMPHPKLIGAISDGHEYDYIYKFKANALDADSGEVIMAYRIGGPRLVRIPVDYSSALITDMLGGETTQKSVDGNITVEIGAYPIYIQPSK